MTADMANGTCSIEGCGRVEQLRRGWCQKHYWRWKKYGDAEAECYYTCPRNHPLSPENTFTDDKGRHCLLCAAEVKPSRGKCAVDDCPDPQKYRQWCGKHYQRWRNTGTTDARPAVVPKECTADGCTTVARTRSWCVKHYTRWKVHGTTDGRPKPTECAAGGCTEPPKCRGWCKRHHKLLTRQGVASEMKRYALKTGTQVEDVDYDAILAEFGMVCHICQSDIEKRADLNMDHVIPLSRGGTHTYSNIRPSHRWCNQRKGSKLLAEYLAEVSQPAA